MDEHPNFQGLKPGRSIPPEGWRPSLYALISEVGSPEVLSLLNLQHPDPQHSACRTPCGHFGARLKEGEDVLACLGKGLISSTSSPDLVGGIQSYFSFGNLCILLLGGRKMGT